jgi:hypothetical protein
MNGQNGFDGLTVFVDGLFKILWSHQSGIRINVTKNHIGPNIPYRIGGRQKCNGRNNSFISRAKARGQSGKMQPPSTAGTTDSVRCTDYICKPVFKSFWRRPRSQKIPAQNIRDCLNIMLVYVMASIGKECVGHVYKPPIKAPREAASSQSSLLSLEYKKSSSTGTESLGISVFTSQNLNAGRIT